YENDDRENEFQFKEMMAKRGKPVKRVKPLTDPSIHKQRFPNREYGNDSFFEYFSHKTFCKLLSAIYTGQWSYEELEKKCSNKKGRLDKYLNFMQEQEIAISDKNGNWEPVQDINNIGPTLEWYVTQWFRRQKGTLACRGVQMEGFPKG